MRINLHKNLANLVVLLRIVFIFAVLFLMSIDNAAYRIAALLLLLFTMFLDFVDGYVARRLKTTSQIGGLLDTLGDRITENLLIVFVAYMRLILFAIAALFVFACFILILKSPGINVRPELIVWLKAFLFYVSIFVLAFNLIRSVILLYDSRGILKENFLYDSSL